MLRKKEKSAASRHGKWSTPEHESRYAENIRDKCLGYLQFRAGV